jgi:hypothetical protein
MMSNNNRHKSDLLGEVYSSARGRLMKMILFQLAKETNKNICFQCGEEIKTIGELSIEHKKPWMKSKNPKESFYDLNNIAFSHLDCNTLAADMTGERNTTVGKSGFRGVYKREGRNLEKPYVAQIVINSKKTHIGYFKTAEEAFTAYNKYRDSL